MRKLGLLVKEGEEAPDFDWMFDEKLDKEIEKDFYDSISASKPYKPHGVESSE